MPKKTLTIDIKQLKAGTRWGEAQGIYELENVKLLIDVEGEDSDGNTLVTESELESLLKRLRNITTNILEEVIEQTSNLEEVTKQTSDY